MLETSYCKPTRVVNPPPVFRHFEPKFRVQEVRRVSYAAQFCTFNLRILRNSFSLFVTKMRPEAKA